jgi:hypothetical protein
MPLSAAGSTASLQGAQAAAAAAAAAAPPPMARQHPAAAPTAQRQSGKRCSHLQPKNNLADNMTPNLQPLACQCSGHDLKPNNIDCRPEEQSQCDASAMLSPTSVLLQVTPEVMAEGDGSDPWRS